eukprot:m51a1_g1299 putative f-box only protein 11 isoform x2 (901) ;mRNA; f:192630-196927
MGAASPASPLFGNVSFLGPAPETPAMAMAPGSAPPSPPQPPPLFVGVPKEEMVPDLLQEQPKVWAYPTVFAEDPIRMAEWRPGEGLFVAAEATVKEGDHAVARAGVLLTSDLLQKTGVFYFYRHKKTSKKTIWINNGKQKDKTYKFYKDHKEVLLTEYRFKENDVRLACVTLFRRPYDMPKADPQAAQKLQQLKPGENIAVLQAMEMIWTCLANVMESGKFSPHLPHKKSKAEHNADIAYYYVAEPDIQRGDIVALRARGQMTVLTRDTSPGTDLLFITAVPTILGHVPIRIGGDFKLGDLVFPSGRNDGCGTARAYSENLTGVMSQVVGRLADQLKTFQDEMVENLDVMAAEQGDMWKVIAAIQKKQLEIDGKLEALATQPEKGNGELRIVGGHVTPFWNDVEYETLNKMCKEALHSLNLSDTANNAWRTVKIKVGDKLVPMARPQPPQQVPASASFSADPMQSMNRSFLLSAQLNSGGSPSSRASTSLSALQTEINTAPAGATVLVPPGVHELAGPISIKRPLRIVGSTGAAASVILSIAVPGARQPAIAITGSGALELDCVTVALAPCCAPDAVAAVAQGVQTSLSVARTFITGGGVWCKDGARALFTNCDVTTSGREGSRGVNVHGQGSRAELRLSVVHDCPSGGIAVCSGAEVAAESCEITRCGAAGVAAVTQGRAAVRGCTISNSVRGASFADHGIGALDACLFEGNDLAGVTAEGQSELTIRTCHFRGGRSSLISVGQAAVAMDDCDLSGAAVAAAYVKGGSCVTMRRCRAHDNAGAAVSVHRQGAGTFEDCAFEASRVGPIVSVETGSCPTLRRCLVSAGHAGGITALDRAAPVLEDCTVAANASFALRVARESAPVVRRCVLRDAPVQVSIDSKPSFDNCAVDRPLVQYQS